MGRIVAISSGDLSSTKAINKYIVLMSKKTNPNLLIIGTASKDNKEYAASIKKAFRTLGCEVKELCLVSLSYDNHEIDELLTWADIIYVGGGDTDFMMNIWRQCRLDLKLRNIYLNDAAVLSGISAGAICWFESGFSGSEVFWDNGEIGYGWVNNMLGFHQYVLCPHYDQRGKFIDSMFSRTEIKGLAMDSTVAFVEDNGNISYIKSKESAGAYILSYNKKLDKVPLNVELVR